jgi:glycine/D-amino acid oxidase-like deaminating enzyme
MSRAFDRRLLLQASVALAGLPLAGCETLMGAGARPARAAGLQPRRLAPVLAQPERVFDLTVCLRPFRAAGPRLDVEQLGDTLVVHNYGHGGSGWSLSWGSAELAVGKALASSPSSVAVVGCGALGLTAALTALRAGVPTTIYAKDQLPQTRSARATGMFTPDSRVALANAAAPGFPELWERMARTSFKTYRAYLGLPGDPVEWVDNYIVEDQPREQASPPEPGALDFARYRSRIRDLMPVSPQLKPEESPFDAPFVYRAPTMIFNIADYGHTLLTDFLLAGGKIRRREFHEPSELGTLEEKVVINCTGYGARALWKDESIVPVRGQIGWLVPQREVDYAAYYKGVTMAPRRDGIVVQMYGGDMKGYGDDHEVADPAETAGALAVVAELMGRLRRG